MGRVTTRKKKGWITFLIDGKEVRTEAIPRMAWWHNPTDTFGYRFEWEGVVCEGDGYPSWEAAQVAAIEHEVRIRSSFAAGDHYAI